MAHTTMNVQRRAEFGKGASKRIRRDGMVPAIVYGGAEDTVSVSVDPKMIFKLLRSEAGRNTILTLAVEGGGTSSVILKDWQIDPVRETILHADFQRIAMDKLLRVNVPIAIRGEAIGVKTEGGMLDLVLREIEVECLPKDIPERIECDVTELEINESIRASDLPIPSEVAMLTEKNRVVVHVVTLRAEEEEVTEEGEEAEIALTEEGEEGPEVIAKGKQEEEGG